MLIIGVWSISYSLCLAAQLVKLSPCGMFYALSYRASIDVYSVEVE